jgi:hypothetical protein
MLLKKYGILFQQYSRALSAASQDGKAKGNSYHLNSNHLQITVSTWTILSNESAFGAVLVERKDGNVSALSKGKAVDEVKSALNERDAFKVTGNDGQPKGGAK